MTELILRGVNLAGLMTALLFPRSGTVSLALPLSVLGWWLAVSAAAFFLGLTRHPRWGGHVRLAAILGDVAVAYWAINWTALWTTELFLFALLPASLLGLSQGPAAGAAAGVLAAVLQGAYAWGTLWPPSLAVRCTALVFVPLAISLQAEALRGESGRRALETLNFLRSGQIAEYLSFVLYQMREYLISVSAVADALTLSVPKDQAVLVERAERLQRLLAELNGKTGRLLGDKSVLTAGRTSGREPFDAESVIAETVAAARTTFATAPVKVRLVLEGRPSDQALSDRQGLRLALLSILQNAMESCSAQGGGTVTVLLRREEGRLQLMVTDDGQGLKGVSPEEAFEPIYCARAGTTGLGLGLPMSRRIVERAGGSLQIRSQNGLTTALLSLPLRRDLPVVRNEESTWAGRRAAV